MASIIGEDLTTPGTHALVIGVSAYRHLDGGPEPMPAATQFGLEQLSAAARSASEVAAWYLDEYTCPEAPRNSLRILLSPSPGEQIAPSVTALGQAVPEATLANVRTAIAEFRAACDSHPENVALVYVAGHGVQLTGTGAVLLLADFGDPGQLSLLERALDMAGLHRAFNHPGTAQTQYWFVDACRQRPAVAKRFETLAGALTLDAPTGAAKVSPLFLSASTGTLAFARPGGLTLFADGLLWSLRRGAVASPDDTVDAWHVPVHELIHILPDRVQAAAAAEQAEQSVDITGRVLNGVVQRFAGVPRADLRVELQPPDAVPGSRGTIRRGMAPAPIATDISAWPFQQEVDAGIYAVRIDTSPPFQGVEDFVSVKPPSSTSRITVPR